MKRKNEKDGSKGLEAWSKDVGVSRWRSEGTGKQHQLFTQARGPLRELPQTVKTQISPIRRHGSGRRDPKQGQGHNICHLLPPRLLPQEHCR